jgi:hypothetical protein
MNNLSARSKPFILKERAEKEINLILRERKKATLTGCLIGCKCHCIYNATIILYDCISKKVIMTKTNNQGFFQFKNIPYSRYIINIPEFCVKRDVCVCEKVVFTCIIVN